MTTRQSLSAKENIASTTKPFNNYLVYIWTALYLEDELADFKKSILKIADKYQIRCPLTIVPVHLSLKISFDIKDKMTDKCIQEICRYFYGQAPFYFEPESYEIYPGILWLKVKDNDKLKELHAGLDEIVKKFFGVQPSDLDNKFKYHLTIYTDTDKKLEKGLEELSRIELPQKVKASNFIVGTSENGRPDTFSVYKQACLGPEVSIKEEWKEFEGNRPKIAEVT